MSCFESGRERRVFSMRALLTLLAVVAPLAVLPAVAEPVATLSGHASVQDGDGLLFGDVEVRLQGIAAPELSERGGPESHNNLVGLVGNKLVLCELDGTTANRRPVGVCFVDGQDVGELQVRMGHARDCPRYSKGRYRSAEEAAQSDGMVLSEIYALPAYCG